MSLLSVKLRSSDLRHGRSDFFLPSPLEIPSDHQEAFEEAKRRIVKAGWGFKERSGITEHSRKFTMTLRKNIWLSDKFDGYHVAHKAAILWHEYIHVKQRQRWGHAKFLSRYATARGRWLIETPAYRMSLRVYEKLSDGEFNGTEWVEDLLPRFRSDYALKALDKRQYFAETRKILYQERRS
jgi:hypothetical protein